LYFFVAMAVSFNKHPRARGRLFMSFSFALLVRLKLGFTYELAFIFVASLFPILPSFLLYHFAKGLLFFFFWPLFLVHGFSFVTYC